MLEDLEDELTSINSIYGDETLLHVSAGPVILALTLPQQPGVAVRLELAADYPLIPPSILGTHSTGSDIAKGAGTQIVEVLRDVLAEVYIPGSPVIFDLIEEAGARLQQLGLDQSSGIEESQGSEANGQESPYIAQEPFSDSHQPSEILGEEPPWVLSEVISEKKSVFVARAARVSSVDEAKQYLNHLLATDKKVAKATHNMTAWRIQGEGGVQYQDCDDDGESAAGGRMLHLLELMGVRNVMVVVTRWYGGVHLGADRFRIINQTARDAVVKAGFGSDNNKDIGKKKGKR